jgi:hypothetical protein
MSWKEVLKGVRFNATHYKHFRQACDDAYEKYGDSFLNDPYTYKDEIVNQATDTYIEEMGLEKKYGVRRKFSYKFPTKIGRIVNIMRDNLKKAPRIPRKKGQPAKSKKHSDLYTDENPKGTIHGLKFATVKDAKKSVNKIKRSGRPHAHKIQAAVAMEQRALAAGKKSSAGIYRKYINSMKKKTKSRGPFTDRD